MFTSLYWFGNLDTEMWFNLQISTFIFGVLCSSRNQGNSAFSPTSFMHTQGCMFCICFFLGSKSQLQRCFSSPLLWDLPVLDISNQGAAPGSPFLGTPWRWLKIVVGSGHISLGVFFLHLGSQISSKNWEGLESTLPTAEDVVEAGLDKAHRKYGVSPVGSPLV